MRVTYSTIRFPPARGGVETYVEAMADIISARGHEPAVITSNLAQHLPGMRRSLSAEAIGADDNKPYPIVRLPYYVVPGLNAYPFSPWTAREISRRRADVIHAYCFYYSSVDAAAAASRMTRTPLVVSPILPIRASWRWAIYRRGMRWVFRQASVTTVLSRYELELLKRSGFNPARTIVVPPSVSPSKPAGLDTISFPWNPDEHRILLFVGRISDAKGVDTLIHALPKVLRHEPEARVVVAGPPDAASVERYRAALAKSQLTDHVWIAAEVSDAMLARLYEESEVFVFPSRYEAFGIVALEAMAYGLPVVVSDAAALPEIVGGGQRGVVHAVGDSSALAAAIVRILKDPDLRQALATAGLAHARTHHSPEAQGVQLEEVYGLAATSRPDRRSAA